MYLDIAGVEVDHEVGECRHPAAVGASCERIELLEQLIGPRLWRARGAHLRACPWRPRREPVADDAADREGHAPVGPVDHAEPVAADRHRADGGRYSASTRSCSLMATLVGPRRFRWSVNAMARCSS